MSDREKKIAEIREGYKSERDDNFTYKKEIVEQDIRFLLSELDRLEREYAEERAAHNAHVAELCELEQERNMYKASSEVFYERLKIRDELLEQLRAQIKYFSDAKRKDTWALFECESCQTQFAIKEKDEKIDEPICPVCGFEYVVEFRKRMQKGQKEE